MLIAMARRGLAFALQHLVAELCFEACSEDKGVVGPIRP